MQNPVQPRRLNNFVKKLLFFISVFFIIVFSILQICKYNNFEHTCYQVDWISHVSWKFFTEGHLEINQLFFSIVPAHIFLLMPVFFLSFFLPPFPEILLVLHTVLMISSVLPLYLLTKQQLKSDILALAFSVSYLFHPFLHFGLMSGFTPEMIIFPCLFFSFYYFERGVPKKSLIFLIISNLGRISIVIMNMLWGLCLIVLKKNRKYGRVIFLTNLIWISLVIICLFFTHKVNWFLTVLRFEAYGDNLNTVIQTIFRNHFILIQKLLRRENLTIFLNLFIPLAFLPLFRPLFLLPVIVSLGRIFFLNNDTADVCFILPYIYLSAIYGLEKFISLTKYNNRLKFFFAGLIIILSGLSCYYLHLPLQATCGPIPLTKGFNSTYYKISGHSKKGHEFLKLIPKDASILAQHPFIQHITRRKRLGTLNQGFNNKDWEYIILDISVPQKLFPPPNYKQNIENILQGNSYGVFEYDDGWLLLKKEYPRNRNQEVLLLLDRYLQ